MIDREVRVETDSTAAVVMTEMIRTEAIALTEARIEATIADRVDQQKEKSRTETVEIIAETIVTTETKVMKGIETAIVTETRIEAEMIAGIGEPTMTDSTQIRETDFREKKKI